MQDHDAWTATVPLEVVAKLLAHEDLGAVPRVAVVEGLASSPEVIGQDLELEFQFCAAGGTVRGGGRAVAAEQSREWQRLLQGGGVSLFSDHLRSGGSFTPV